MYPVYPASIMLDTNNYDKMEFDEIPNIVIYTSVLASNIKVIQRNPDLTLLDHQGHSFHKSRYFIQGLRWNLR